MEPGFQKGLTSNNRLHLTRATGTPACLRNLGDLAAFGVPRPQVNLHVRSIWKKGQSKW